METLLLFASLAGLACLIWLLSLISTKFSGWPPSRSTLESAMTFALVAATGGQLLVAIRQAAIMEKQADISSAQTRISLVDQRPWIRPAVVGYRDIVIDEQQVTAGLQMVFKNSGKTPATHVSVRALWGAQSAADRREMQRILCSLAEATFHDRAPTIYPSEDYQVQFSHASEPGAFRVKWGNSTYPYLVPELYGCVAYKTAVDDTVHHARFAFALRRGDAQGQSLIPGHSPQTIKSAEIVAQFSPYGYNDAD